MASCSLKVAQAAAGGILQFDQAERRAASGICDRRIDLVQPEAPGDQFVELQSAVAIERHQALIMFSSPSEQNRPLTPPMA